MSSVAMAAPRIRGWELWKAQAAAILGVELRKNFITKRGFWIYLLAVVPAVIVWIHSIVAFRGVIRHSMEHDTQMMAGLFQAFFVRPAVYFGCVGIFTYLFRGEVVERTLHFYFLSPVRREVLVAGKYGAGLITALFFFCGSIVLSFAGMYAHYPSHEIQAFVFDGPGLQHLFGYVGVTALACAAYGALFLWFGIKFKNPIIPAVLLMFWESLSIFLPVWLKKISILFYLRSLAPVTPNLFGAGLIVGGVTDPVSPAVAVLSLVAITVGLLALAARQLQRSEVSYSSD